MMIDDDLNGRPAPFVEPAWSIYLAFDEGEYLDGGSTDPVETFKHPQLRHLSDDAQQL